MGLLPFFRKQLCKPFEKRSGFKAEHSVRRYHEGCEMATLLLTGFAIFLFVLFLLSFQSLLGRQIRLADKIHHANVSVESSHKPRIIDHRGRHSENRTRRKYLAHAFWYHWHASDIYISSYEVKWILVVTCMYYANFHLTTFVWFLMSTSFGTCVSHSAKSIAMESLLESSNIAWHVKSLFRSPSPAPPSQRNRFDILLTGILELETLMHRFVA